MKTALLALFLVLLLLPCHAFAFGLTPCSVKERFDADPALPPGADIAQVAGHVFKKRDTCVAVEVGFHVKEKDRSFQHNWYDLEYSQYVPGELWMKRDAKEFVLVANPANYSGTNRLVRFNARGESCHHSYDQTCDRWTAYGTQHATPSDPRFGTSLLYTFPSVVTHGETVGETLEILTLGVNFRNGKDYALRDPTPINNLALARIDYDEIAAALRAKKQYRTTVRYNGDNDTEEPGGKRSGEATIEINFGCPTRIRIATPAPKQKFVFSTATPGVVELAAAATIENYPDFYLDDTEWRIDRQKEGTTIAITPQKGKTATITLRGLPRRNADFGPTKITARLQTPSCGVFEDSVEVNLFFPRDASNSPVPSEPNWYYYWSQTSAARGAREFTDFRYHGRNELCGTEEEFAGYFPFIDDGTRIKRAKDYVYVCDFSKPKVDFSTRGTIDQSVLYTGIDAFAVVVGHEILHRKHWIDWWNPKGGWPHSGVHDGRVVDADKDMIPDAAEPALGYNPHVRSTHAAAYHNSPEMYDEHHLTYTGAEKGWSAGKAEKEDWAKPGQQWE